MGKQIKSNEAEKQKPGCRCAGCNKAAEERPAKTWYVYENKLYCPYCARVRGLV